MLVKIIIIFLVCIITLAQANLRLSNVELEFLPNGQPHQEIIATNEGKDVLYIDTEIYQILHPGTPKEQKIKVAQSMQAKFVVTPHRFIIKPQKYHRLRFINLNSPLEKDKIYIVNVVPKIGKIKAQQSGLRILIGYGVLVTIRPNIIKNKITYQRTGKKLTFYNKGNSHVIFDASKQCEKNVCRDINRKRLHTGVQWELDLPFKTPVQFTYYSAMQKPITLKIE